MLVRASVLAVCLGTAAPVAAQSLDSSQTAAMSLEELMSLQVVTTASKFPQSVREAPGSVSVITAEEIQRHGYRTLADVLRGVRGLYTSYDRNYEYLGVRGFARPGDFNTRVLLLLNGHRLNDPIYDMAPIGTDFPVDVTMIERVEVIRGPASSVYGTNALFGVINVITRTGSQLAGLRLSTAAGSQSALRGSASFGHMFRDGSEVLVASSGLHSDGASRLYFPELAGDGGTGVVRNLDGDTGGNMFASVRRGSFSLSGGHGYRKKYVPTAAFGTVPGDRDFYTVDNRGYVRSEYERPIAPGWTFTGRGSYDDYEYQGSYPLADGAAGRNLWVETAESHTLAGEVAVRGRVRRAHLLSIGTEVQRHVRGNMEAFIDGVEAQLIEVPSVAWAVFAQDDFRVRPWLILSAGVRHDHSQYLGGRTTPRAGVVLMPRERTTVKILHGRAFRAPNTYETFYYALMRDRGMVLHAERLRASEIVWEEHVTPWLRTVVTGFDYHLAGVIEQRSESGSQDLFFVNGGGLAGRGMEFEVEARTAAFSASVSHTAVRARTAEGGLLSNSPAHLSKARIQVPVRRLTIAGDLQVVGARRVLSGERLSPTVVPNLTVTAPVGRRVELSASVYNATDTFYADPGAEEHLQAAIPQDGATALVRARFRF